MTLSRQINLAVLGALLLVVSLAGGLWYLSVQRGFRHYVSNLEVRRLAPAAERLAQVYATEGGWQGLNSDPRRFGELLQPERDDERRPGSGESARPKPNAQERRSIDPLELPPRVSLYDADRVVLVGRPAPNSAWVPLLVEGRTVGWLGVRPIDGLEDRLDLDYLAEVRGQLWLISAAAIALGLLAAGLLTRRILLPVTAITDGVHRLRSGDLDGRLGLETRDELGQLARDVDHLARVLAESAETRRQWVADTSHELRTPITVLRAEIEALVDGVRPLSLEAMLSLRAEVQRLSDLVEGLAELARSDREALDLSLAPLALGPVLKDCVAAFRPRFDQRGLKLDLDLGSAFNARISADHARLQQVFSNLLENSARYTDVGGRLLITVLEDEAQVVIGFDDSAPAVPDQALPRLFERFFRSDASRSREHGGSGLGLAICHRWVEAQGGTIGASHSPLGGLRIEIVFPSLGDEHDS